MAQKSAKEIRELNLREPKAWRVIDQHLRIDSKSKVNAKVRQAAAEFILKRIYPEKVLHGGDPLNPIAIEVIFERDDSKNQVQAPRFAAPSLQ